MDSMAIMDLVSAASLGTNFSIIMDTDLGTNLSTVSGNTDARLARKILANSVSSTAIRAVPELRTSCRWNRIPHLEGGNK